MDEDAIEEFQDIIELYPNSIYAHKKLATAYSFMRLHEEAVDFCIHLLQRCLEVVDERLCHL